MQKFALPSFGKRVSSRVSLALVPDLSNHSVFIAIHDAYHWIWKCHYCIFVHRQATDGKKGRYILRLAVKCNQNDTDVKDQAIDAVQA